jgi:hypothetical protein
MCNNELPYPSYMLDQALLDLRLIGLGLRYCSCESPTTNYNYDINNIRTPEKMKVYYNYSLFRFPRMHNRFQDSNIGKKL